MEVKINREIRNYTESMFFGLSLRQLIFSALAVAVAVGLYFLMKPYVGTETVSWVCVLGAAPLRRPGLFHLPRNGGGAIHLGVAALGGAGTQGTAL